MASFPFQFTSAAFWWISVFLTQMSDSRLPVWWRLAENYQRLTELVSQQTWLKKDSIQQPGQGKGAGSWSWWTLPPKQERWSRPRTKPVKQASITPILPPLLLPHWGPGFGWCLQTHAHLCAPQIQVFGLKDEGHCTPSCSEATALSTSLLPHLRKPLKTLQTFTV